VSLSSETSYSQKNEFAGRGLDGIWAKQVILQLFKKEKEKKKKVRRVQQKK